MVSEICLRIALPYIERARERERERESVCVCAMSVYNAVVYMVFQ